MKQKLMPSLYGLENSNRKPEELWGKNQFNSSFPASLAAYMRDNSLSAAYISTDVNFGIANSLLPFEEVLGTAYKSDSIKFEFESKFNEYTNYGAVSGIDLVISELENQHTKQVRALEVKLTVIPDNTTHKLNEKDWATEIVIRPASTSYSAIGIFHKIKAHNKISSIEKHLFPICSKIQHWDNKLEVSTRLPQLIDALEKIFIENALLQQPFLLQPIWKTKGKSPFLADNAFDIFVWSDFALCHTFVSRAKKEIEESTTNDITITRFMRSTARLARVLYELAQKGSANIEKIYTEMSFELQNDKEFALNGRITAEYMHPNIRYKPRLTPSVLKTLIMNGGEELLSPERRFDQTIFFTAKDIIKDISDDN